MKLSHVIEELIQERGLDRNTLNKIICEGMLAAYQKRYPDLNLDSFYNKKEDEVKITIEKTVVASVEDEDTQISLRKARSIKEDVQLGDILPVPFDKPIGRIEILKAKQVIAQKIRSIEALAVYQEFKPKENTIVHGVIHKCERNGMTIKLQNDTLAFLPKSLTIANDKCTVGYTIRALLKEVYAEPRNENQIILDRTSSEFLKQLFELEVPEIYEKLVEIKKIARSAGYKSKILVTSHDKNIDPVGTCVGVGGSRIKPILRELGTEKIDIIAANGTQEELIKSALKPAQVNRVEMLSDRNAIVWVDEDMRSVAIGKMGQNIALASKITGINIQLASTESAHSEETRPVDEDNTDQLD